MQYLTVIKWAARNQKARTAFLLLLCIEVISRHLWIWEQYAHPQVSQQQQQLLLPTLCDRSAG